MAVPTLTLGLPAYHEEARLGSAPEQIFGYLHRGRELDLVPRIPMILGEQMTDASNFLTHPVSEVTRNHVTVALGGDGNDEQVVAIAVADAPQLPDEDASIDLVVSSAVSEHLRDVRAATREVNRVLSPEYMSAALRMDLAGYTERDLLRPWVAEWCRRRADAAAPRRIGTVAHG